MSDTARVFWKWLLIGMTITAGFRTLLLAATGDMTEDFGVVVTGGAITIAGLFIYIRLDSARP